MRQLRLSPSAIKRFENCRASHIYYMVLPRIEHPFARETAHVGSRFHEWAEHNFNEDMKDILLSEEKDNVLNTIGQYSDTVKARDYFLMPSIEEVEVWAPVNNIGIIWGYPDRIILDLERWKLIVLDYKTAAYPTPYSDKRQVMHYLWAILTNFDIQEILKGEFAKKYGEDKELFKKICDLIDSLLPGNMEMILDYVQADEIHRFNLTERDAQLHENYLVNIFSRVQQLESEFEKHKNINKVQHTDGNCSFCFMRGVCKAFHVIRNASYDPIAEDAILQVWKELKESELIAEGILTRDWNNLEAGLDYQSVINWFEDTYHVDIAELEKSGKVIFKTQYLVSEYLERQSAADINKERADALKRALLVRSENGDPEVEKYFSIQRIPMTSYPRDQVLDRLVPKMVKLSVKNSRFSDMIDRGAVERDLKEKLSLMLSKNLSKSDIPKEYLDEVEDLKQKFYKKPFLKARQ